MSLSLPPRYTNTPATAVFDIDLPDPLFRTLTQLHGLAWQSNGQLTQVFTLIALAELRGLQTRQVRSHLTELESWRLIEIERLGGGRMRVYLKGTTSDPAASLEVPPALASCQIPASTSTPATPSIRPELGDSLAQAPVVEPAPSFKNRAPQPSQPDPDPDPAAPDPESLDEAGLAGEIAQIFIGDGDPPAVAQAKAQRLIIQHGYECCEAQLDYFPTRCQQAQSSARGLRNPSGLFIRSVSGNWAPPRPQPAARQTRWYTDEEYELYIVH